jgi:glycosyltransferase involved in cell wall biosynthesis
MKSVKMAVWAGAGVGGTQKAATLLAIGLTRRGHRIDFLSTENGAHQDALMAAGVRYIPMRLETEPLVEYVRSENPDLVHQYVAGNESTHPIREAFTRLGASRPKLLETNVFGLLRAEQDDFVDFRFFITFANAAQAYRRIGKTITSVDLSRIGGLHFPQTLIPMLAPQTRNDFRKALGIGENEILAIRLGRPRSSKWKAWEYEAFCMAKKQCPHLKLLLMEPREDVRQRASHGSFSDSVIIRRVSEDYAWIDQLYASSDIMVHASTWGESFGYTIAEAMAAGVPVIVRTTPWGDNAQVELVQNGRSGYVCASVPEMGRRLTELAQDPHLRERLGTAARDRMMQLCSLETRLDLLEAVMRHLLDRTQEPLLQKNQSELLAFDEQFASLEWTVSEPHWRHPIDYLYARCYNKYRHWRYG